MLLEGLVEELLPPLLLLLLIYLVVIQVVLPLVLFLLLGLGILLARFTLLCLLTDLVILLTHALFIMGDGVPGWGDPVPAILLVVENLLVSVGELAALALVLLEVLEDLAVPPLASRLVV